MIKESKYLPLGYKITETDLNIVIHDTYTIVQGNLQVVIKPGYENNDLTVNCGESNSMKIQQISINNNTLSLKKDYTHGDESIIIKNSLLKRFGLNFTLTTTVKIFPQKNTSQCGLFSFKNQFYNTQCEPYGFSEITCFPDRPDALSKYKVRLEASKRYSVLLTNGELISEGEMDNDRHWKVYYDKYLKPCYLFALVVGNYTLVEEVLIPKNTTKRIRVQFYVQKKDINSIGYAAVQLYKAINWDIENFNLHYERDIYRIVCSTNFSPEGMENTTLNIFDENYLLASPYNTSDQDINDIKTLIYHEYFHHATGNTVTCLHWGDLCLKEGLTVLRTELMLEDENKDGSRRINKCIYLRDIQYKFDISPFCHSIRKEYNSNIENIYTNTVYYKSSEIWRILRTIIGKNLFSQGLHCFVNQYKYSNATCDDFVDIIISVCNKNNVNNNVITDINQFRNWFTVKGSPKILMHINNKIVNEIQIDFEQINVTNALVIPCSFSIYSSENGCELLSGAFTLREKNQKICLPIKDKAIVSVFRGLSAPIKLLLVSDICNNKYKNSKYNDDELDKAHNEYVRKRNEFLIKYETDAVSIFDATQNILIAAIFDIYEDLIIKKKNKQLKKNNFDYFYKLYETTNLFSKVYPTSSKESFIHLIEKRSITSPGIVAHSLTLPPCNTLALLYEKDEVDAQILFLAVKLMLKYLANQLGTCIKDTLKILVDNEEKDNKENGDDNNDLSELNQLSNISIASYKSLGNVSDERILKRKLINVLYSILIENPKYEKEIVQKLVFDIKNKKKIYEIIPKFQILAQSGHQKEFLMHSDILLEGNSFHKQSSVISKKQQKLDNYKKNVELKKIANDYDDIILPDKDIPKSQYDNDKKKKKNISSPDDTEFDNTKTEATHHFFSILASLNGFKISANDYFDLLNRYIEHSNFSYYNIKNVKSLFSTFAQNNFYFFHHPDGRGYKFLMNAIIELGKIDMNELASELVEHFIHWDLLSNPYKEYMRLCLVHIQKTNERYENGVEQDAEIKEILKSI